LKFQIVTGQKSPEMQAYQDFQRTAYDLNETLMG
jgi:hypothetical protein